MHLEYGDADNCPYLCSSRTGSLSEAPVNEAIRTAYLSIPVDVLFPKKSQLS